MRDIHKTEKRNCISISVFGYENKEKFPIYVSKKSFKRRVDLLLIEKEGQLHYVLIKDFNTFMHNQTLHRDRKHFYLYCLQSFCTAQILERHVNDSFEINDKQITKMAKKTKLLNLKTIWET